ncbi:MAG: DNA (cytosine-5-)-methyltransferase [Chloroflexi bacterium]|nr:DNA (cytosine-5-)-methyltransferase [Chloroflexota bacterium]
MQQVPGVRPRRGSVVDLFCGVGGLSHGFYREGYRIAAGVDVDEACRYPFETNNEAPFVRRSVEELTAAEFEEEFTLGEPTILVGCAPCQPFSKYSQGREDSRWQLLKDFARLIRECRPDIVSMENVPRLPYFKAGTVFDDFVRSLRECGYIVAWTVAFCPDYGVPQSRSRLVLIASRHGQPALPAKTHGEADYATVWETIGALPALGAGDADPKDALHQCSRLSTLNLERIRASKPGGTWRDWPKELVTMCHKRETGQGYSSVYGRMAWNEPAPTMTTQFFGFGNGRFGHPEQDRAISIREGAMLQTFPRDYEFLPPGEAVQIKNLGRMIGNAVPVTLGRAIARAISNHIEAHGL